MVEISFMWTISVIFKTNQSSRNNYDLGKINQLVQVTKLRVKGVLIIQPLFQSPFLIAAKVLYLTSLAPFHIQSPLNFLSVGFTIHYVIVTHVVQCFRKKSKLEYPPCSDPKYGNNRLYLFHSKHWVKFSFHNMSPSKLYCTLPSLSEVLFPSETSKVPSCPTFST